ncbi:ABC transporter ATP-binding protein [Halobacillus rhizosphaerae]|uniref:ABC transporter ATP-binding protein n=1 Tax=Halobacillus rhizosphaerae TaxID=3064889 RepID=UPI00398A8C5F
MKRIAGMTNMRLKFPGAESLLFKDFSLSLNKGEKVLILGPSGSGKSTLLQALTGLIPNAVEVPMKADELTIPDSWGMLFQDPDSQFCMPYVDEEIAFVLENLQVPRNKMKSYIEYYLQQVGLKFDDIHTNIQTLSGGMKQRLAIASVLALEPEVLFLDEPTAMLDPEGTKRVWETIKNVGEDKTLVIVEHKIDQIVDFVDRVILLGENGNIMADGTKQEVINQNKETLLEQGIWYPHAWEEYIKTTNLNHREVKRDQEKRSIYLADFSAFRGKIEKFHVKQIHAHPGDWVTVTGANGAGKSTLLLALMNLIKNTGTCQIFEQDHNSLKNTAEYMTLVFQNPEFQFVTNSVYEEAAFSLQLEEWGEKKISRRVNELLNIFQLADHQDKHPYQLSTGQKRRLSIAASIGRQQPILLLDEPTFGQDAKNTFAILEQLEQLRAQGMTIIMVTHDLNIVKHFSTKVWSLVNGELVKESISIKSIEEVIS